MMQALTKQDRFFLGAIKVAWDAPEPVSTDVQALQMEVCDLRYRIGELIDERDAVVQRNRELDAAMYGMAVRTETARDQLRNARWLMVFFFLVTVGAVAWSVFFFLGGF